MSNWARAILRSKIRFSRSKVGDDMLKKMKKLNYNLGGEQSGPQF